MWSVKLRGGVIAYPKLCPTFFRYAQIIRYSLFIERRKARYRMDLSRFSAHTSSII